MTLGIFTGCATAIPPGERGIERLVIEGADSIDRDALKACLAIHERPRFGFDLGGRGEAICGEPPFDTEHIPVHLWAWPWTEWPIYDPVVFERDQVRVERWYRARGYYGARVTDATAAATDEDGVALTIEVEEGFPVHVRSLTITGDDDLSTSVRSAMRAALSLAPGARFDEASYEDSKQALRYALGEAGFAHAEVTGRVLIDPKTHTADVQFTLAAGRPTRFGRMFLRGQAAQSASAIWGAAGIEEGTPFSLSALSDARRAVYALGPFASVEVEPLIEAESDTVDVLIKVVPGQEVRWGFGVGLESGGNMAQQAEGSFAQWDAHLLGRFEHRNFLGGMRRLRIEDRPRLVFDNRFPNADKPNLGNALEVDLRQPAFLEPRLALRSELRWDLGPDPFGGRFFRSDFNLGLGPERHFFGGKLLLASSANWHQFRELPGLEAGPYPNYDVFFLRHVAKIELRDDPRAPRSGAYLAVQLIHAGFVLPGDFDYIRVTPDLRTYVPLPAGMVLATRARLGVMHVAGTSIPRDEPPTAQSSNDAGFRNRLRRFGPLRHRLRGGGHNSVRGYRPNELGDAVLIDGRLDSGGLRQWEASIELRVPITTNFGAVLFADAGDVARHARFRFDHLQTSFGIGLRYKTLVGPLRLDAGFAPPDLQVIGRDTRVRTGLAPSTVFGLASGAVHFTIGEAF